MMNKIIDLTKIFEDKAAKLKARKLDAEASIVLISQCLSYLKMNKLEELEFLKALMKKTVKDLQKIVVKDD